MAKKQRRHYIRGSDIEFDDLMRMFRDFTDRDPTPEEVEEARAE